MKLKKNEDTKTYHVCFERDDGTPVEVDTRCESYQMAKAVAHKAKARELEVVSKAVKLSSEIVQKIISNDEVTMAVALGRYKVWATSNLSPRTADSHIMYATKWLNDYKIRGYLPQEINEHLVNVFVNGMICQPDLKASTRRVRRAALKSFMDYCFRKGWTIEHPVDLCRVNMRQLSHSLKETKSHEPINTTEISALMLQANPFWKMAIYLASETGLRLGDICSLEWACFSGNVLSVWTDKTDTRVSITLPDELINTLCSIPVVHSQYVFPFQREQYRDTNRRAGLSIQFKRLIKKTGLIRLKSKSFHGLRAHYAQKKRSSGSTKESIAKDLGHSSTQTTDVYLNAEEEVRRGVEEETARSPRGN